MSSEGPPGLTGWAARTAEPIRAVWDRSELPGTEGHMGSFGWTARPGKPWREPWQGQAMGPHESRGFYLGQCMIQQDCFSFYLPG